jgi:putative ABC transport system permease protein
MTHSTPPDSHRTRLPRLPRLHLPSIIGRARADRGPLLLCTVVVTIATLLASAVPPLIRSTSDDALQQIVADAGTDANVAVTTKFDPEQEVDGSRHRPKDTVEVVDDAARSATFTLDRELRAVLRPPLATVTSTPLQVAGHGQGRTFQLAYIAGADRARVTWTAGGPPKAVAVKTESKAVRQQLEPWSVQVGLSEQTAAELGAKPGDRIDASYGAGIPVEVRVSGTFRPVAPNALEWQLLPQLVKPSIGFDGTGSRIEMTGLMSADSLPDGRLALDEPDPTITVTYAPEPSRLQARSADHLGLAVRTLKSGSGAPGQVVDPSLRWESRLDTVLKQAQVQLAAASAQASVLLVGLLVVSALVLLLATDLLVRRRANVLTNIRMRGAALAGIGAELVVESIAVTLVGAGLGLLLARALTGDLSWTLSIPVALVAVLGGPVLGTMVAARATRGRQAPANRSARRTTALTGHLRRVAAEVAVLLAAAGAYVALRERGVVATGPNDGEGLSLQAFAPTLGAATGALVLLRLLPPVINFALKRAARSRRSLPLLAAARAAATAARPLPFLVLVMSSALLTFALAAAATASDGQADGAWRAVGADARLELEPAPSVQALAERMATAEGVHQAVPARVADNVPVTSDSTIGYVRLVVVDAKAFRQLLATTPLPDAPQLGRLGVSGKRPLALLRSADPAVQQGKQLTVRWNEATIELARAGTAPAVGGGEGDLVIVDAAAFAAAGAEAAPNTVWMVGPGAAAAAATVDPKTDADVTLREKVYAAGKSAPLAAGLLHLAYASTGILLLFGALSVALGAATSAPGRGETLARLRTLGLRSRESRQLAVGELLPPVAFGALGGVVLGAALAHASLGLLSLRLITGQSTDPALVVPLLAIVPVGLLMLVVAGVVRMESSLHRRERLGQILRAGNS